MILSQIFQFMLKFIVIPVILFSFLIQYSIKDHAFSCLVSSDSTKVLRPLSLMTVALGGRVPGPMFCRIPHCGFVCSCFLMIRDRLNPVGRKSPQGCQCILSGGMPICPIVGDVKQSFGLGDIHQIALL